MRHPFLLLMIAAASMTLGACENTKKQFSFDKKAPDEFAVTKRAPLEMPPDYSLRPPRPGIQRPQEKSTDKQARRVILGEAPAMTQEQRAVTSGESILLQKTGVKTAIPDIRRIVDQETAQLAKDETPTIDRIMKVTGKKIEAPASIVDPIGETERIRNNDAKAKTPTIED